MIHEPQCADDMSEHQTKTDTPRPGLQHDAFHRLLPVRQAIAGSQGLFARPHNLADATRFHMTRTGFDYCSVLGPNVVASTPCESAVASDAQTAHRLGDRFPDRMLLSLQPHEACPSAIAS